MHGIVDQPSVTVEDVGDDGVVVAAVHGDLDVDTFREVRQGLFSCLNGQTSALVVDLGDVGFFGSMGIAVLVEARQRADVLGAGFAVVAGRRTVARPIRMTDMEDLLRLHRTQDEALATVRNGVEPHSRHRPDHDVPDHHGPDHLGPDHHSADHHGPDHHGPDHRGPDHRGPDHHSADHHGPDHHGPDHRGPDHRSLDHRGPDHRSLDHRGPDHRSLDHRGLNGVAHHATNGVGHHAPDPFDRPEDRSDGEFSWWSS